MDDDLDWLRGTSLRLRPEQLLAVAVIGRAVSDLTRAEAPELRAEAWRFLTDDAGDWATSRRAWLLYLPWLDDASVARTVRTKFDGRECEFCLTG